MSKISRNQYVATFRGDGPLVTDYIVAANIRQAAMVAVYQGNVRHLSYHYIEISGLDTKERLVVKKGELLR